MSGVRRIGDSGTDMTDEGDKAAAVGPTSEGDFAVTGGTSGFSATVRRRFGGGISATAGLSGGGISATDDGGAAAARH